MADTLRVTLELGPKGKRVVAVAPDWPGLERGAKTEEAAIAHLQAYLPRYAPVANLAEMEKEFTANATVEVVERYQGVGSTDFWGVSLAFSDIDKQAISSAALERELRLLRACWAFFDEVRSRVSAEMTSSQPKQFPYAAIPNPQNEHTRPTTARLLKSMRRALAVRRAPVVEPDPLRLMTTAQNKESRPPAPPASKLVLRSLTI